MKNKCFWSHDWDKWIEIERGNIISRSLRDPKREPFVTGKVIIQERQCKNCGIKEIFKQEIEI